DNYTIKISTSKDPAGGASDPFFIAPSLPVSTLLILKPSTELDENDKPKWVKVVPDGKDGWFKIPPSIDFAVDSPTAKIKIWWNDATEKAIDWTIGKPLGIADQQRLDILHWQAIDAYGNEEVRSYEFKIDTNSPTISITEPSQKTVSLKTNKFNIVGLADPTELLKYEDKNNSPYVVPDVFINGEKIEVVQAKVEAMKDSGAILNPDAGVFRKEITLPKEGVYKFEVWAEDQAGWLSSKLTYTVTYDITAPEVKMLSPVYGDIYQVGEEVEVRFESELSASLFVNNTIANVLEQIGEDKAIFSSFVKINNKGENVVEVKASDPAGNTKPTKFTIMGPTSINLWLGQTTMVTNGIERKQLPETQKPINTFPKNSPYVKFNGNTFMAIRPVAEKLNAKEIAYDPSTKTVTITQTIAGGKKKVIELVINKTTAKIDGKSVQIEKKGVLTPILNNGTTLLPLRFVGEALGAEVLYEATQKMISINYPPAPKKP
ncbi:MAG: copper amine oxidase N-terminal domain-containing protein, partial [Caldiserica bacterium]|nr:copper amine oxidase N-terminal domain-containing protein [Caldisericota bacterium]